METQTPVRVELGPAPRSERRRHLRAEDPRGVLPRVERVVRLHFPAIDVTPQTERGSDAAAPFDLRGSEDAGRSLIRLVRTESADALGRARVVQTQRAAYRIAADVDAEGVFSGLAADTQQSPVRQLCAGRPALLVLLELVAILRIAEKVGEVVEQLHTVALHVRGQPR